MQYFKFRSKLISYLFLALISFPVLNKKIKFVKDIENCENRELAKRPKFVFNQTSIFLHQFETYFNDRFSIRFILVKAFNELNVNIFHQSPLPDQVVLGKDGWLFSAGEERESYRGNERMNLKELNAFRKELEYRQSYLKQRKCEFYVVVAPVKSTIYPEQIPNSEYNYAPKQSWGEQLIEYLQKNSTVKIINVYPTFRALKNLNMLYYKTDDHWDALGAFYAAQEVLKRFKVDFSELTTDSIAHFNLEKKACKPTGDLAKMLSFVTKYKDFDIKLKPENGFKAQNVEAAGYPEIENFADDYELDKEVPNSTMPRLLIISDSFGERIFPFLAEHFSRTVKIFDAWQYKLNEDIVAAEQPDIELLVVWQSNLRDILLHASKLK